MAVHVLEQVWLVSLAAPYAPLSPRLLKFESMLTAHNTVGSIASITVYYWKLASVCVLNCTAHCIVRVLVTHTDSNEAIQVHTFSRSHTSGTLPTHET